MLIIYIDLGRGWDPITHMVNLATTLFDAELITLDYAHPNLLLQLESVLLRRDSNASEACLVIAPSATYLAAPLLIKGWRNRFKSLAGWVIDSFWEDRIPKFLRYSHLYDHLFVTTEGDLHPWRTRVNSPVEVLPWGSDVLQLGGGESERPWDLLRVGRQPCDWDNDEVTLEVARCKGLSFHGRPAFIEGATPGQTALMRLYRQSKYLLAFSNLANPTNYTHPTREYLTARWMDALACGAVVAGIHPKEPGEIDLLWNGALLDLGTTNRTLGLELISSAIQTWTPAVAEQNHLQALRRLDWRWRFLKIASALSVSSEFLCADVSKLECRIAALESST